MLTPRVNAQNETAKYNHTKQLLVSIDTLKENQWKEALATAKAVYDTSIEENYLDLLTEALYIIADLNYYNIDRDGALVYFEEGLKYAKINSNKEYEYKYCMELAKWYLYRARDHEKSADYFQKAIEIGKFLKDERKVGRAFSKMALMYVKKKDLKKVEECLKQAEDFYISYGRRGDAAYYYTEAGSKIWEYDMNEAVDFFLKALEIDPNHYYPNLSIGNAYIQLGLPNLALPHLHSSIKETDESDQKYGLLLTYLAEAHFQLKEYEIADSVCDETIKYFESKKNSDKKPLPTSYLIKGKILEINGQDKKALEYYNTSLETSEDLLVNLPKGKAYLALGLYYLKKNDVDQAYENCYKAYENADEYNFLNLNSQACECLYSVFKKQEDYDLAITFIEQKEKIEESLNAGVATQKLQVLQKLKSRESEIQYEQEIATQKLANQVSINKILRNTLIFGTCLLIVLGFLLRRIIKQNSEINKKSVELENTNKNLTQSNEELERFAYITSHDLKTPMLIIVQFSELLSEKLKENADASIQECVNYIKSGGERMMNLIDDVLEYSRTTNMDEKIEIIELRKITKELADLTKTKMDNAIVEVDFDSLPNLNWNYTKIFLLFKNLIENGLKYNESKQPKVWISGQYENNGDLSIYIKDNGIGIDKEYHEKIFVMFNRLHNQSEYDGSGLGLASCKKIVSDFGGKISLTSEKGKGTSFKITIPKSIIVSQ